jgi:hypothetical protein
LIRTLFPFLLFPMCSLNFTVPAVTSHETMSRVRTLSLHDQKCTYLLLPIQKIRSCARNKYNKYRSEKKLIVQIDKNGLIKGRELRICKEPRTMWIIIV